MASKRQKYYSADFFKKDTNKLSEISDSVVPLNASSEDEDSGVSSDNSEVKFNHEDMEISRLYRKVVDWIMSENKLREKTVNLAIDEMKREISAGHRKGFRNFREINFRRPSKCCAYLRRYAICHTGLVKQAVWNFLGNKSDKAKKVKEEMMRQSHLKVISLGGGPGNDFVGFCSALQEFPKDITGFDLCTVDISKSWETVFPAILRNAKTAECGSFGKCLKETKINVGFMTADLTEDGIFENKHLSAIIEQFQVVLMVKLASFLPDEETENLIDNVVHSMKQGAILIFIDQPYNEEFFRNFKSLQLVYHSFTKYELSVNPAKYQSPSISSSQAHIAIYKHMNRLSGTSSDSDSEGP